MMNWSIGILYRVILPAYSGGSCPREVCNEVKLVQSDDQATTSEITSKNYKRRAKCKIHPYRSNSGVRAMEVCFEKVVRCRGSGLRATVCVRRWNLPVRVYARKAGFVVIEYIE